MNIHMTYLHAADWVGWMFSLYQIKFLYIYSMLNIIINDIFVSIEIVSYVWRKWLKVLLKIVEDISCKSTFTNENTKDVNLCNLCQSVE